MKILERSSFISQQNLSYILLQRICLLFDNILFVAIHYLTAVGMATENENVYSNGQNMTGITSFWVFFAN